MDRAIPTTHTLPLLLMGKGIVPGEYLQPASPTDIAPTLALLAGRHHPATGIGSGADRSAGAPRPALRTQAGIKLSTVGVEAPARQGARSAHTGSM